MPYALCPMPYAPLSLVLGPWSIPLHRVQDYRAFSTSVHIGVLLCDKYTRKTHIVKSFLHYLLFKDNKHTPPDLLSYAFSRNVPAFDLSLTGAIPIFAWHPPQIRTSGPRSVSSQRRTKDQSGLRIASLVIRRHFLNLNLNLNLALCPMPYALCAVVVGRWSLVVGRWSIPRYQAS